ncbi:MAG TPA: c-type cytochrome biogenesis protein CcmI [Candidatus Binataceae bacterium]|nr:c-type cytochrome biogenesis protein CcmI [Candidatus Binataceae bacterium]
MVIWIAAIMIVAAVAMFVAAPLTDGVLRQREARPDLDAERLEHERALALQGLRELEFDHEMGKLGEADYKSLREGLEARALAAMSALDAVRKRARAGLRLAPRRARSAAAQPQRNFMFCSQCGVRAGAGNRFCAACGAPLGAGARSATRAE